MKLNIYGLFSMLLGKLGRLLLQASCVSVSLTAVSNVVLPEMCVKVNEAAGMRRAEDKTIA